MSRRELPKPERQRLQLSLSPTLKARIERIAQAKKVKPQRVVLEALRYYLPLVEPGLEGELAEWDRLSDEALEEFEKRFLLPPIA